MVANADASPPSTWVELASLPNLGRVPVFAIAVDPVNDHAVIAGGGQGGLYRSADGGATWTQAQRGSAAVLSIAFSPFNPSLVLAGTRDAGALMSTDGGVKWSAVAGLEGRQVRAFGFARTMIVAGTDHGVYASDTGATWTSLGLSTSSIDAIAVAAVNPPVRLVAGGDSGPSGTVPLWTSADAGATWTALKPAISGTIIT
ncbi:MAG: hypothetical protein E6I98_14760, partial [Chloroflexi bacterium]